MKTPRSLIFATLAMALAAMPAGAESCNASNSIQGWGIWCGVERYAAQMTAESPTAAGPAGAAPAPLKLDRTLNPDILRGPDNPGAPARPNLPIPLPETGEPAQWVGYRHSSAYTRSPGTSGTTTHQLGSLTLKLETGGVVLRGGHIRMTTYDRAGSPIATIEFSGNTPLFRPPGSPHQSTRVDLSPDPTTPDRALARRTTSHDGIYEEERFTARNPTRPGLLKNYWVGAYSRYTAAQGRLSNSNTYFIAGELTPEAEIERLAAGNVTATYRGESAFWRQEVAIDVDFKAKRFDGHWGAGPGGAIAFGAQGDIVGRQIVSDGITGADSGFVTGSFFHPDARMLGGAYEVHKGGAVISDVYTSFR